MIEHGTLAIPEANGVVEHTPVDQLDGIVATVADNAKAWVDTSIEDRIALLSELRETTHAVADDWANAAADGKGISADSPLRGEGWLNGPMVTLRHLRLLQETLEQIRDTGAPKVNFRTRAGGQVVADVFPAGPLDNVLYTGMKGEVWLQPHVTVEQAEAEIARVYRPGGKDSGGTCLVLGAGNVSSIPPMDVLTKLFNDDRVAVLKMNPVNEHLGPFIEAGLRPLIDRGFLAVVYGGREVGEVLTTHDRIDELHMTGSDKTFDAIVWGPGAAGEKNKTAGTKLVDKSFSAELGSVSPVIVVPGPWSASDIEYQADSIASMLVQNGGFNCVAARVLVTHGSWARRRDLLDGIRTSLGKAEQRVPYYPGAVERWERFVESHPQAEWFGKEGEGRVPFTLIPDVPETEKDATAFRTEAFCGVFAETPLDAPLSIPTYLQKAVDFCNDTLWGTLSATIIVHPRSMKDPAVAATVNKAIEDLEYGCVVVNAWSAVAYGMVTTSWGAFPGSTDEDIQSGRGVVHNSTMLESVQKSVVRAPFKSPIKPPTFHTHATLDEVISRLTELEATGDLTVLPGLLWQAMRG
jgi:acyl-CoA reductase-like NAD-dependent aldehyde dehydrogenase